MSVGKFMKQAAERDYSQWWQKPGTFPWMFQQAKPPLNPPDSARPIPTRENYERAVRGRALRGYDSPCFVFSHWCGLVKNWRKARHPLTLISAQ